MSTKKKQLFINVKLKNKGEMVLSTTMNSKTKILNWIQGKNIPEWQSGMVRVTYSYKNKYYNHSEFENVDKLAVVLAEFLDPYLVKRFS